MSNLYINKALRKDIPSDAIIITKKEALQMQWDTLKAWRPQTDTWPFRYGIGVLAGINALTTVNLVHHYRRKLFLGNYGRITMVLPTAVLPCLLSVFGHVTLVTDSILAEDECPLCIQSRAALVQVGLGVIYPVVVTPFAGFYYAFTYGTCNVPPLKRQFIPELLKMWLDLTRKLGMRLPLAIIFNGLTASVLAYFEANSFYNVKQKIRDREHQFVSEMFGKSSPKS